MLTQKILMLGLFPLLATSCFSTDKDKDEDEDEDETEETREEGTRQGDCTDGIDNDDDGYIDCDDQGCDSKPVCDNDTGFVDTEPASEPQQKILEMKQLMRSHHRAFYSLFKMDILETILLRLC